MHKGAPEARKWGPWDSRAESRGHTRGARGRVRGSPGMSAGSPGTRAGTPGMRKGDPGDTREESRERTKKTQDAHGEPGTSTESPGVSLGSPAERGEPGDALTGTWRRAKGTRRRAQGVRGCAWGAREHALMHAGSPKDVWGAPGVHTGSRGTPRTRHQAGWWWERGQEEIPGTLTGSPEDTHWETLGTPWNWV